MIDCVSTINTGAKYNDDVFQFSVGLNGVGTKAVNALSSFFKVKAFRGGSILKPALNAVNSNQKTKENIGTKRHLYSVLPRSEHLW